MRGVRCVGMSMAEELQSNVAPGHPLSDEGVSHAQEGAMPRDPLKSLESLVAARKVLAEKEGRLLDALKRTLGPAGFVVTPVCRIDGGQR